MPPEQIMVTPAFEAIAVLTIVAYLAVLAETVRHHRRRRQRGRR